MYESLKRKGPPFSGPFRTLTVRGRRLSPSRRPPPAAPSPRAPTQGSPTSVRRYYRLRLTSSSSIESAVEITRELAWKPRCAVIMLVNVEARSTLDISTAPACVMPVPPPPGVLTLFWPELAETVQVLPPLRSRPEALENVASVRR